MKLFSIINKESPVFKNEIFKVLCSNFESIENLFELYNDPGIAIIDIDEVVSELDNAVLFGRVLEHEFSKVIVYNPDCFEIPLSWVKCNVVLVNDQNDLYKAISAVIPKNIFTYKENLNDRVEVLNSGFYLLKGTTITKPTKKNSLKLRELYIKLQKKFLLSNNRLLDWVRLDSLSSCEEFITGKRGNSYNNFFSRRLDKTGTELLEFSYRDLKDKED